VIALVALPYYLYPLSPVVRRSGKEKKDLPEEGKKRREQELQELATYSRPSFFNPSTCTVFCPHVLSDPKGGKKGLTKKKKKGGGPVRPWVRMIPSSIFYCIYREKGGEKKRVTEEKKDKEAI